MNDIIKNKEGDVIATHIVKANEMVAELLTMPHPQQNEAVSVIFKSIIQNRQDKQLNLQEQAKAMQEYNDELKKVISGGKMTQENHNQKL